MKKLIHYNREEAGKLHCDACGYDMPDQSPFTPDLIGTPCPRCGADMLTQADYDKTARMFAMIDWLNKYFGWLGSTLEEAEANGESVSVKIHGDEFTIRKES